MHIIVLGGAGAMGRVTVRALSEYDDIAQVTVADYNEARAHELAAVIKEQQTRRAPNRCSGLRAAAHPDTWRGCRIERD